MPLRGSYAMDRSFDDSTNRDTFMKAFGTGSLQETQNQLRHEFNEFVHQWQQTKSVWKDEPARQFEEQCLADLAPTLNRVSGAIQSLVEAVHQADRLLDDPDEMVH